MIQVLQSETANIIVERKQEKHNMMRLVCTCTLDGLKLQGNVELKENRGMTTDWEVVSIGDAISRMNKAMQRKGACCTQCLRVGDRVVSVNGKMEIGSNLSEPSPNLFIVRWRKSANIA